MRKLKRLGRTERPCETDRETDSEPDESSESQSLSDKKSNTLPLMNQKLTSYDVASKNPCFCCIYFVAFVNNTVVEITGYYQLSVWLLCDLDFYLCSGTNISFQFCNVGMQIERLIMLYECELLVAILEVLVYLLYLLVSKSLVL